MVKWAVDKSIVNWDNQDNKKKGCYEGLLHQLGNGFKGLLENGNCNKRNRAMVFGGKHIEESCSELHRKRFRESSHDDGVQMSCVVVSDDSVVSAEEEGLDLSSKKQGDLPEILKWLTLVARCPHDPSIGVIPHCSKWKDYTGNECCIQLIRAKNALLVQRDNAELRYQNSPLLSHQTMHPSMYEDDRKSTGRLRYSIRRPNLSKHHSSLCCNGNLVSLTKSGPTSCRDLMITETTTSERADLIAGTFGATDVQVYSNAIAKRNKPEIPRRYVAAGRHNPGRVDKWTESGLNSDTKWLGTRIWPLETNEALDHTLGNDLIGKGRPDSCSCDTLVAGSVECIRFHIAEKRMQLKRDLGNVFFHWRFNQMGEEVSLRWTEREEKKFKDMIISDPQSFWEDAASCFQRKNREQLVSYYFNVFLINRRRYQNRVTPRNIDSDDDEPFGSVGNSFGRNAVTSFGSDIMICSQNLQCEDFD